MNPPPTPADTQARTWFFSGTPSGGGNPDLGIVTPPPHLTRTTYTVTEVVEVRGLVRPLPAPGSELVRIEGRLPPDAASSNHLLFYGTPQHLNYTHRQQRDELAAASHPEHNGGESTLAVLIPIRKSAAWWALAEDERRAHFTGIPPAAGHTAIGTPYVRSIHRRLYHCRYLDQNRGLDFITYFEFQRDQVSSFRELLTQLRDPALNPEWTYVEAEAELWMTKPSP